MTFRAAFRVGLMGASLRTGNRGVSALAASVVALISQSQPDSAISLLIGSRNTEPTAVRIGDEIKTVGTVNYRLSPRAPLGQQLWWILLLSLLYRLSPSRRLRAWIAASNHWVRFVADADFIGDIRGGDSFSDIYGLKNLVLDCIPVFSVLLIGSRFHLLPQTYGPFRSRVATALARFILLRADSIWSRDRAGADAVRRLTDGKRTATLCPDVAFALKPAFPQLSAIEPPLPAARAEERPAVVIGLNVNGLVYHGGYTRSNMFGLRLDYPEFLRRVVEQLLADPSHRVLMVPHTLADDSSVESDPAASRAVRAAVSSSVRDRVHLVEGELDQHELKALIGTCEFFIGSRMHACIAALSQGIPTVGVAYSQKFYGVFDTVGAGAWVIDGRTQSVPEALARVGDLFLQREANRPALRAGVAAAQNELRLVFDNIAQWHHRADSLLHAWPAKYDATAP